MSTPLLLIVIGGACLGGWALLSVLAAERLRLLSEIEARRPRPAPAAAPSSAKPPATTATPKPRSGGDSPSKSKPSGIKRPKAGAANAR